MKLNIFKNKADDRGKKLKKENRENDRFADRGEEAETERITSSNFVGAGACNVLKGFYVSEKATSGHQIGRYAFKVYPGVNKSEIKKEVAKLFDVKVKKVRISNVPEKRRDTGRHPGSKSGFKKAIVVLKEGQTIGQAKR